MPQIHLFDSDSSIIPIMWEIELPFIGKRIISRDGDSNHFKWLSIFGWHDCSINEDLFLCMIIGMVH